MTLNFDKSDEELKEDIRAADAAERKSKILRIPGYAAMVVGLLIIPIGIISLVIYVGYGSYQASAADSQLMLNPKETQAYPLNEYLVVTRKGVKTYRVSYSFSVDNQRYSGTSEVSARPGGQAYQILYDPDNPSNNKIKGGKDEFEYSVIPFVSTLVVLSLIGVIGFLIRWGERRQRIAAKKKEIEMEIEKAKKKRVIYL